MAGAGIVTALAITLVALVAHDVSKRRPPSAGELVLAAPPPAASPRLAPEAVPTPATNRDDPVLAYAEIVDFRNWLRRNPDPSLVDLVYHRDCPCHAQLGDLLRSLRDRERRFADAGTGVVEVTVVEEFPSLARLHVVALRSAQRLVDADGRVVAEHSEPQESVLDVVLVRQGSRWLVRTITRRE